MTAISVVIVTWLRPDFVRGCLDSLGRLEPRPAQVIVVDASPDERTAAVIAQFPWAQRIPFRGGAGHMTRARNVGLRETTGEIVAFLDDDTEVRAGWMAGLLDAFADPSVGAVSGRTCNGVPGEEREGVAEIGRVRANGQLTAGFAADPGMVVEVDHGIGANMSFRREILARLGGLRDDFVGAELREDTDIFLRVRALGARAVFAPDAVVDHLGAPHAKGRRFDYRYQFSARYNHVLLLARNFGLASSQLRAWVTAALRHPAGGADGPPASPLRLLVRGAMGVTAVLAGLASAMRKARWKPLDPARNDRAGVELRARLSDAEASS